MDKQLPEFYADANSRDGVRTWCKKCLSEYSKKYHQEHREENCAKGKKWRQENEKAYRAKKRAYYLKNKDRISAKAKQWDLDHPEESWANDIRYRFGITRDTYYAMLSEQGGVCKICGGKPTGRRNRLSVDHDHTTGIIRGLLCEHCNRGLGCFKDDLGLFRKVIEYLQGPQD
jgi:hypothetical protein